VRAGLVEIVFPSNVFGKALENIQSQGGARL
jgi:hypothetical protein